MTDKKKGMTDKKKGMTDKRRGNDGNKKKARERWAKKNVI
jgi:hypothetical protein